MSNIFFANITKNDNVLIDDKFHMGAVSIGVKSITYTFLFKNESGKNIHNCKVYLHTASSYAGNRSASEDLNEILNIWPTVTNKNNEVCGLYMYTKVYDTNSNLSNLNNWVLFNSMGTFINPYIIPKECILNGTKDGYINNNSYAQLLFKFVSPNLDAFASVKSCRINVTYLK